MILNIPIDIKSFHFNIKNDNRTGHTATVNTPIKQGNSVRESYHVLHNCIPEGISGHSREKLIETINGNSEDSRILKVYVFNNLSVNNVAINPGCSFCFYIREETKEGYIHNGRQKLHYKTKIQYSDDMYEIDNERVKQSIIEAMRGYAFITESFEYDTDSNVLNFNTLIVGPNQIPYSKVFINEKGNGNKFVKSFEESTNSYDIEISSLRDALGYDQVNPSNFNEIEKSNKELAISIVTDSFDKDISVRCLSDIYPYSLFDLVYEINAIKHYVLVLQTSTNSAIFTLSRQKIAFLQDFKDSACIYLVKNINQSPKIEIYNYDELMGFSRAINSITFIAKE